MNTLPKSLTIAFLALYIFISGLSADLVRAQSSAPEPMVTLTPEEKAWLIENPHIKLATLTNQPPFSMLDADRNHTGILSDILELLSVAIGQKIEPELVNHATSATHEVAKEKGVYGSASILKTSGNASEYLLSDPFMMTPFYIYATTKNRSEIRRPEDLNGKRVAVPRNHRAVDEYLAGIDGVQTITVDTPLDQMQKVVSGEADALIGYFTYPYLVNKYLMVDLVIAFIAKSDQAIHLGVNPEHPVLLGIINKAIASIDVQTINAIAAKWTEASKEKTPRLELTPEEQAWLKAHPEITLGISTSYPPHVVKNPDGTDTGVLPNLYGQISQVLNTNILLHIEDSWPDIQKKAENGEIDGLAIGGRDPNRDALYNATATVYPSYFSVFVPSRHDFQIKSFSDLDGLRIGYKRGARPAKTRLEKLPSAILMPYDDHESMTQDLLSKEIDVIVAWMSYDHWRKKTLQGTIDKIYMIEEYPLEMVIYIRKDWPELIPILNKALVALQQDELPRIINKWFGEWPELSPATIAPLTSEERAWLAQNHRVRVRVGNHPPWLMNTPEPTGMAIEYLNIIGEFYGITFNFIPDNEPWIEGFKDLAGKHLRFDLYPTASRTPERLEKLAMSQPYLSSPWVIFTRVSSTDILRVDDLRGRKVAVERGYVMQKRLEATEPEIELFLVESEKDALLSLSTGEADAYIGNLIVTSFILQNEGISNIKVAGPTPYGDHSQTMATRKEWAPLISIINKGLASIPSEQKITIRNKYLSVRYEHGVTSADILKWVLVVAGAASGFVMFFVVWNKQLSRKVRERTAEVEESETKYRGLVDNSIVGVFASTIEGRFTFVNDAMARMFDFDSPEAMIAQGSIERWREPGDRARMLAELKKHGRVTNFEAETLTHTDQKIDVLFSARQIGNDIFGMAMDVTERKRIERELQKSHNLLKHLLSSIPDAVFSVRLPERVIEWAEDSYNTMGLGDKPGHVQGLSTLKYFAKPEDYKNFGEIQRQAIREGKRYMRTEVMLRREDGTHFPAEITGTFYRENGEITRITALARDITDRKQAEQKLIDYQQRLKAMASQLAIVEEKERQRIAFDLHDHVGQSLALARMQLASARKSAAESALAEKLDDISDTLLEALEDTQQLMLELSSPAMNESGLSAAISEWLELQIGSRHSIKTEFIDNIPDDLEKKLDANVRTIIFRNVRELLYNVVKHARANKISVRLEDRNTIMRIIVEDDGMGFEPHAVTEAGSKISGFGLFSIEELMADLGVA
jgi:PAS domain S-box-containing protein